MERRSFIGGLAGILLAKHAPAFKVNNKPMVIPKHEIIHHCGGIIRNDGPFELFFQGQVKLIAVGMGLKYEELANTDEFQTYHFSSSILIPRV